MLAVAMAEERLVQAYVAAAAAFVQEVAGELPLGQALAVYGRLLDVPPRQRKAVELRALAFLGESMPEAAVAAAGEQRWSATILGRVIRRVRGRRRSALRARVESAAGRAYDRVKAEYLEGANTVAGALRGIVPELEAVELYADALGIDRDWAKEIFEAGTSPGDAISA